MDYNASFLKFFRKIIFQILQGLFHKTENNHDFARFPIIKKNKVQDYILWFIDTIYFFFHSRKFFKSYQLMSDNQSKELFIRLIVYKIAGSKYITIKNEYDWGNEKKLLNAANQFYVAPSEISLKEHPVFGGLNHYQNIPTKTGKIALDCWLNGIACLQLKKQYYFSRNEIRIQPESGDNVIDGGGCFGDTSIFFAKSIGTEGKVYVFDPLPIHGVAIQKNIFQNNLNNQINYFPYAISEVSNETKPTENVSHTLDPGFKLRDNFSFPIISIDDFVKKHNINKINFIKMDIEGHELLALKGAAKTIKTFMPKLAISIYHRREDFYKIPLWLNQITDSYQYYIDHYTIHAEETVLYAISK